MWTKRRPGKYIAISTGKSYSPCFRQLLLSDERPQCTELFKQTTFLRYDFASSLKLPHPSMYKFQNAPRSVKRRYKKIINKCPTYGYLTPRPSSTNYTLKYMCHSLVLIRVLRRILFFVQAKLELLLYASHWRY